MLKKVSYLIKIAFSKGSKLIYYVKNHLFDYKLNLLKAKKPKSK